MKQRWLVFDIGSAINILTPYLKVYVEETKRENIHDGSGDLNITSVLEYVIFNLTFESWGYIPSAPSSNPNEPFHLDLFITSLDESVKIQLAAALKQNVKVVWDNATLDQMKINRDVVMVGVTGNPNA